MDAAHEDPRETLPELERLLERMLEDHGYDLDDEVAREGLGRDLVADVDEVRRVATLLREGQDVDPGDVGAAYERLREIYQTLSPPTAR
jgi:beta-phosphoglucomutase-like phosphatase (HAD superfamily)